MTAASAPDQLGLFPTHLSRYALHGPTPDAGSPLCGARDTRLELSGVMALHHVTCQDCIEIAYEWTAAKLGFPLDGPRPPLV